MMTGLVFDIQRFALHDGPGIRTTVFLKGCPLRCAWCHNPESQSFKPELSFWADKCQSSFSCVVACPTGAMRIENGQRVFERNLCDACGLCAPECSHGALKIIGAEMTVERVMQEVIKDIAYYKRSGGGLTISGGEPMAQFEFTRALLRAAKSAGIHTCVDTCGFAPVEKYRAIIKHVDLFLFDYKATDAATHRRWTGVSNDLILSNFDFLYHAGARIIVRCPLVPGVNDTAEHLMGIAELSQRYPNLLRIDIMAYHNMGVDKARRIGREPELAHLPNTDDATKSGWIAALEKLGCTNVALG